jgi:amidohydrolase
VNTIKLMAENYFDEIVAIRRNLHRYPEVGRTEVRTSKIIREKLKEYGVESIESPCPTAVVGLIHGAKENGKCIALRADIDALPITEETGLSFASETPGVMHACGHDMHTSMLLGTAKILCNMREHFQGTVKLIFQHSEDTLPGGAKELVEKGVMENPKVDAIIGMHILPDETRVGEIGVKAGPVTTSVDLYEFHVHGRGGHGSAPHTTDDPILAAAQMIVLLQQIVSRKIDPLETAVFSIGNISGGSAVNIIPNDVKFSGVSRTYSETVRAEVDRQIKGIARGIEFTSGTTVEINHGKYYPSLSNDLVLTDFVKRTLIASMGDENVVTLTKPMSFSEDFSYYTIETGVPCTFLFLFGGYKGDFVSLHNPKCILREEAMLNGIIALSNIAIKFLSNN